jgi:cytochrome b pre-mRNA-processing protein 3
MFSALFTPLPVRAAGLRLLATVTDIARQPALYGRDRVADTIAGRFETMTLFASLAILRLRQDPAGERVVQAFVDASFKNLDAGLRESGVGDLTVPKKMKAIAGAVYGRMGGLETALAAPNDAALCALLNRTVFAEADSPFAGALATYVRTLATALADTAAADIERAERWPRLSA